MLRLAYADSGSACKLAGVQIIPLLTLANQILARTFFRSFRCPSERIKFSFERCSDQSAAHGSESNSRSNVVQIRRASACVPSRWKVLSGEFRRRPTALAIKFQKPARVGRRGLSEPREDFSRLITHVFPWLDSVARFRGSIPWLDSVESSIQLWWLIQSIQDFSRGFSNHCIFIFISSNPPHNSSNWIIA